MTSSTTHHSFYKKECITRLQRHPQTNRRKMTKSIYRSLSLSLLFLFFSLSSAHNKTNDDASTNNNSSAHVSFNFNASYKGCFSKVYAFGGSDIDTGNAHFLGGLREEGSSQGSSSVKNSNRRLSNGRLMVDFLCDTLSLPRPSPYKQPNRDSKNGVNFAVAGSTTLSSDFFLAHNLKSLIWKNVPLSYQTQIDWFRNFLMQAGCKASGKGSCSADIGNSLFWIGEMGVSDYVSALVSAIPLPPISEISVGIVCELLKTLLDNGAKYIVVQGLPPVGCLPAYIASSLNNDRDHMGCVASANIGIVTYNHILQDKLEKLRKQYPHCTILYADYWNAYLAILANPKKYQIEEPFKACSGSSLEGQFTLNRHSILGSLRTPVCKDPHKYISWDGIHLTEEMNKKVTSLFLNEGFCKPSFSGLVKSKVKM